MLCVLDITIITKEPCVRRCLENASPSLAFPMVCVQRLFPARPVPCVCVPARQKPSLFLGFIHGCQDCLLAVSAPCSPAPCPHYTWFSRFGWFFLSPSTKLVTGSLALASRSGYPPVLLVCGCMYMGGCCQLPVSKSGKWSLLKVV